MNSGKYTQELYPFITQFISINVHWISGIDFVSVGIKQWTQQSSFWHKAYGLKEKNWVIYKPTINKCYEEK